MSVTTVDLVLAVWLLASAFVLGHTPVSTTLNVIAAIAIGIVARLSLRRPAIRYVNSVITLIVVMLAVLLPSLSAAARINGVVIGLLLLALSAVSPLHGPEHAKPPAVGPEGIQHPWSPD